MRLVVLVSILIGLAVAALVTLDRLPPQHSPIAALDLAHPVGLATGFKLGRLREDPARCRAVLAASALDAEPIADRRTGPFCGFFDAVALGASQARYEPPVRATCPLVAALHLWEREVVRPATRLHLRGELVAIEHVGTYACRRIGRDAETRPSQHATANAIDISAFALADGRRIDVARGWHGPEQEAAFLRAVRDGACELFRAVLGPDYNAAHRTHFHLDMGPARICR
jgi:hypothetical protein